ncbi:unnamed protein product [Camellia sinensis]
MGSGFSFLISLYNFQKPPLPEPSLGDLPEGCVASILVYLDPPEICTLSRLNRAFRFASSADFVWESKLPPNYDFLIRRVFDDFPSKLCMKDMYARMCQQNSLDGGTKKVWLDKITGRVCLSISSKGLAITGIDDRRYWNHIPTTESRWELRKKITNTWGLQICLWWGVQMKGCEDPSITCNAPCIDSTQLLISSKSGGLKSMERWSSHFHLGPIAYSSGCIWAGPQRGLVVGSATLSTSTVGIKSLCGSSFRLQMGRKPYLSAS